MGDNPLNLVDPFGLKSNNTRGPNICNGTDCVDPPFDPTEDGPRPSPQQREQPAQEGDDEAGRYDMCNIAPDWAQDACKSCVDIACNYGGASTLAYCCDIDKKKCEGSLDTDPVERSKCEIEYIKCTLKAGK